MATTEQRLQRLGLDADRTNQPRSRRASDAGARYRLVLALAGLAALVGWGLLDHFAQDRAGQTTAVADHQPRHDGHGKWGGYMPR